MHEVWGIGVENPTGLRKKWDPKALVPVLSTLLHGAGDGEEPRSAAGTRRASTNRLKSYFNLKKKKYPTHQLLNEKFLRIVPELVIFADLRNGSTCATESSYTFFRFLTRLKTPWANGDPGHTCGFHHRTIPQTDS